MFLFDNQLITGDNNGARTPADFGGGGDYPGDRVAAERGEEAGKGEGGGEKGDR